MGVDLHLLGLALAVAWIAISIWIAWINSFLLIFLLAGVKQSGE